jgi:hypothetical protein
MLDDTDLDIQEEPKSEPPRRGNRFVVIAGTLGAIMLLSLVAIVIYALVILPEQEPSEPGPSAAQQTGTALAQVAQVTNTAATTRTATASAAAPTDTNTPLATNTPLVTSTPDPATATVNALLTQAALAQTQAVTATGGPSPTPGTPTATPTALPNSGFADDIGALGLIGAAGVLLVVVILARRLRNAA